MVSHRIEVVLLINKYLVKRKTKKELTDWEEPKKNIPATQDMSRLEPPAAAATAVAPPAAIAVAADGESLHWGSPTYKYLVKRKTKKEEKTKKNILRTLSYNSSPAIMYFPATPVVSIRRYNLFLKY